MLIVCSMAFVGLCVSTTIGLVGFLSSVSVAKDAILEVPSDSTWSIRRHGSTIDEVISGRTIIDEGDRVIAGGSGRGLLRLFDDSVVNISFDSQVTLDTSRTNEFFGRAQEIRLTVNRGAVKVARSGSQEVSSQYIVSTGHSQVEIEPLARVRFVVENNVDRRTQVVVEGGRATLRAQGAQIVLGPQQMAWVSTDAAPEGPLTAEKNFVDNGNFTDAPTSSGEEVAEGGLGIAGWLPIRDEGAPAVPSGSVTITDELGLRVAILDYRLNGNVFPRVGMVQTINEPAELYNTIELTATVKLVEQEQSITGPGGDLYPLIVKVVYEDSDGDQHEWRRSFYIKGDDENLSDLTRVQLPVGQWETTAEMRAIRQERAMSAGDEGAAQLNNDLFTLKSPTIVTDIAAIRTIEVYGSGSLFQSGITGISLLAR